MQIKGIRYQNLKMIDTPKDEGIYTTCKRYIDKSFPIELYEFLNMFLM